MEPVTIPHIVIVGAGFGGLTAAKHFKSSKQVKVTVIDRHNYHLFQPLLYQVACAALSPDEIAVPIRSLFHNAPHIHVMMDEVIEINPLTHTVKTFISQLTYDYLILAPGSEDNYFGHSEFKKHCFSLKSLHDASLIRQNALRCFEEAELLPSCEEKKRLTTFIMIGGGPTGVEMAGALAELSAMFANEYHHVNPLLARIILIEAGPRILSGFPTSLSETAKASLEAKGVEVMLNTQVENVTEAGVIANGTFIPASTVIWCAGVKSRPIQEWFKGPITTGKGGRVKVEADLSISGSPSVFVIGDAAEVLGKDGHPLPGLAPVAKQEGAFVAKLLLRRLRGDNRKMHFRYHNYGTMATIGRYAAIADFGKVRLKGIIAWILWGIAHIYYLVGFRNRTMVVLNWLFEYITYARGNRLIIQEINPSIEAAQIPYKQAR